MSSQKPVRQPNRSPSRQQLRRQIQKLTNMSTADLLTYFQTDIQKGLSDSEARKRLRRFGSNQLVRQRKTPVLLKFFSFFVNPLILILIVIGTYFLIFTGDTIEAFVVYGMALISVILDFWQEYKADRAVEKLQNKVALTATIIRQSKTQTTPIENLVPGDILLLKAGDLISADGIILEAKDFFLNQSAMTGEAFPVEKFADAQGTERFVYSGTAVQTGFAKILITHTGFQTQFAKIILRLNRPDPPNAFFRGIQGFSGFIVKLIIALTALFFVVTLTTERSFIESLSFSIAIAVGLTPEFLPMIVSVCMGRGAKKMAQRGVIVRKMSALPNLGSMDVLCTDKTGTLTEDKITLIKCTDIFGQQNHNVFLHAQVNSQFQSDVGNSLDHALLVQPQKELEQFVEIDEIPFSFDRRRSTVIVERAGERYLITKGAPEDIFPLLKTYHDPATGRSRNLTLKIRQELDLQLKLLSEDGLRVLAVAIKKLPPAPTGKQYTRAQEKNLEILGFVSFLDPLKKTVAKTVSELYSLGLEIKVFTGDNDIITRRICEEAGIDATRIVLGYETELLSDKALTKLVQQAHVFARCNPLQKERLIQLLQKSGATVGYLGDGINDAPALKLADVGISVDNAVDVAREAADIILTKKSLRVLEQGIIDGRKTFVNAMKYIKVGMSSSLGNVISLFIGTLFLPFLPLLPLQIIFNDFLYDMSQMTIAYDRVDNDLVKKPQRWNIKEIINYIFTFGPVSSFFDLIFFFILIYFFNADATLFQTSWFIFTIVTQTLILFLLRSPKPLFKSRPSIILIIATLLMTGFGIFVALSDWGSRLGFGPVSWPILTIIVLLTTAYCILISLFKKTVLRNSQN